MLGMPRHACLGMSKVMSRHGFSYPVWRGVLDTPLGDHDKPATSVLPPAPSDVVNSGVRSHDSTGRSTHCPPASTPHTCKLICESLKGLGQRPVAWWQRLKDLIDRDFLDRHLNPISNHSGQRTALLPEARQGEVLACHKYQVTLVLHLGQKLPDPVIGSGDQWIEVLAE